MGRSEIIDTYIKKNHAYTDAKVLDVGSGFGALVPTLKKYGSVECVEPFMDSKDTLRDLGADEVYNYKEFPVDNPGKEYDLVSFFDVIEHIEDDVVFLKGVHDTVLSDKGSVVITVPAYNWLWTAHDDEHNHFRRYTKSSITKAVREAGYTNIQANYFMSLLFPLAAASRMFHRIFNINATDLKPTHKIVNTVFFKIFSFEKKLITKMPIPFGLSIIVTASK